MLKIPFRCSIPGYCSYSIRLPYFDPSYLNSWICAAFGRTVRELDLTLWLNEPTKLPLTHISCNVPVLKLKGNIHCNIPATASVCFPSLQTLHLYRTTLAIASNLSISFPKLKILHLKYVSYADEDSIHKLLSSCPVLDDLVMDRNCWDNVLCLIIRIPSLTRLCFTKIFDDFDLHYHACKLQLDTAELQYLNLDDFMPCEYLPMENFDSLLQANVRLVLHGEDDGNENDSTIKFLGNLSSVKFLSITGDGVRVFWTSSANILLCFSNLTRLEIGTAFCSDSSLVINNLRQNMDDLEHPIVNGYWSCYSSHQSWWTEPPYVPKCLLSRVTTISFHYCFLDCCDQLELLRYFLKNAKVLQLLTTSTSNLENTNELLNKISIFPRVTDMPSCN